jgi:hypothetical protein
VARFVKKNYPEFRIMYETVSTAVN